MDETANNLEKLLILQQKVVVLRNEVPNIYEELLKKQGRISAENLVGIKLKYTIYLISKLSFYCR